MSQVLILKGEFLEGSDFKLLARVTSHNRTVISAVDLPSGGSTVVNIYDLSATSPQTSIATATLTSTNLVYSTLLGSSDGWTQDGIGANFMLVVANTTLGSNYTGKGIAFPAGHAIGGHRYRIEALITTAQFGVIPVVAEVLCRPVYSA